MFFVDNTLKKLIAGNCQTKGGAYIRDLMFNNLKKHY